MLDPVGSIYVITCEINVVKHKLRDVLTQSKRWRCYCMHREALVCWLELSELYANNQRNHAIGMTSANTLSQIHKILPTHRAGYVNGAHWRKQSLNEAIGVKNICSIPITPRGKLLLNDWKTYILTWKNFRREGVAEKSPKQIQIIVQLSKRFSDSHRSEFKD